MDIAITGIGTAVPRFRSPQKKVVDFMAEALQLTATQVGRLEILYQNSGIDFRHSVLDDFAKKRGSYQFFPNKKTDKFPSTAKRMELYKQNALPLALQAIHDCFSSLKSFKPQQITHLITVSCTGMYAPGIDIEIIEQLNLAASVQRTAVNFMGCYGVFNALKVAHALCKADSKAQVLLVSVELCTLHFQKSKKPNDIIASTIFADGAGAAIIQAVTNQQKYFSIEDFYCDLIPQSKQEMAWHIADQGFDMVLSSYVPQCIENGIANFLQNLLKRQNLAGNNIEYYAIHPGGLKILQSCERALAISAKKNKYSYQVLSHYGNMSSATILFVLKALWDDLELQNKKNIFGCAFGPGLTLESMLLKTQRSR